MRGLTFSSVLELIKRRKAVVFLDGKADPDLPGQIERLVRRRDLLDAECRRRGVRFLPKQVMRPIYTQAGLQTSRAA